MVDPDLNFDALINSNRWQMVKSTRADQSKPSWVVEPNWMMTVRWFKTIWSLLQI